MVLTERELEDLRNAVDTIRRIQKVMMESSATLRSAQLPEEGLLLQRACVNLGRVRNVVSKIADRRLTETQPIEVRRDGEEA